MSHTLDCVLAYAAAGWRMFPIARGDKNPICKHGVHDATTDPEQLKRWWKRSPGANPAVNCEAFWVLDIDPRNGGDRTLAALIAEHGALPATWTAKTGGGGHHYYFKHDERLTGVPLGALDIERNPHSLAGIDVKGNGKHYVLTPPAVSDSGPYSWEVPPSAAELASAPDWLIERILLIKKRKPVDTKDIVINASSETRIALARAYAKRIRPSVDGEAGQMKAINAAAQVARGFALTEEEAFVVLMEEWNHRCQPPWDDEVIRRKISDTMEGGDMPIGLLLPVSTHVAEEFTADEVARAGVLKEALICEHQGNFYVYNPRKDTYEGPFRNSGLPAVCRRHLKGLPDFSYQEMKGKAWVNMSGRDLVERYGCAVAGVEYHAKAPDEAYDVATATIRIAAYSWNEWQAVYHEIVNDLLHAQAGDDYPNYESYLWVFRRLGLPLVALLLSGEGDAYKSHVIDKLSRFWGPRDKATPCDATDVLNRFSGPLLKNPVVRSDESLALSEMGKKLPEKYRLSISSTLHNVERKGSDPVALHSALRHIIAVNDTTKVFGAEVDNASTLATLARYLVLEICPKRMAAFEAKWAGTPQMAELNRYGNDLLLEHVRWIEENTTHTSQGRLFVVPKTDEAVIRGARFADDTLVMLLNIAVDSAMAEVERDPAGQLSRMPLLRDEVGALRLSSGRLAAMWDDHALVRGSGLKRPSSQKVGCLLKKAGFKAEKNERGSLNKFGGWRVNESLLKEFVENNEEGVTWEKLDSALNSLANPSVNSD